MMNTLLIKNIILHYRIITRITLTKWFRNAAVTRTTQNFEKFLGYT